MDTPKTVITLIKKKPAQLVQLCQLRHFDLSLLQRCFMGLFGVVLHLPLFRFNYYFYLFQCSLLLYLSDHHSFHKLQVRLGPFEGKLKTCVSSHYIPRVLLQEKVKTSLMLSITTLIKHYCWQCLVV